MAKKYSPILHATHFDKPLDLVVGDDELSEMQKQTVDFFSTEKAKIKQATSYY